MGRALLSVGVVLVLAGSSYGAKIAVFDNAAYVDTAGNVTSESDTVQASLGYLGHNVSTFTGITASAWVAAGAANDLILIPELENGDLYGAMDAAARAALAGYVAAGGGLVVMGSAGFDVTLLNGLFGFALVGTTPIGVTQLDTGQASGTPFGGGASNLPGHGTVYGVFRSTLPVGAFDVYHDPGLHNAVFGHGVGLGQVVRVGWDWAGAGPIGSNDGGWIGTLDRSVAFARGLAKIPEPGSWLLFGLGLAGLAGALRRRRRRAINPRR